MLLYNVQNYYEFYKHVLINFLNIVLITNIIVFIRIQEL